MTIQARAYDDDTLAQTLTYKLYWGENGVAMDTKTGTSGQTVTFTTKTGLAEYTTQTYSWKVEVTDDKSDSIAKLGTDRTKCSGMGLLCSEGGRKACDFCLRGRVCITHGNEDLTIESVSTSSDCSDCGGKEDTMRDCVKCGVCGNYMGAVRRLGSMSNM